MKKLTPNFTGKAQTVQFVCFYSHHRQNRAASKSKGEQTEFLASRAISLVLPRFQVSISVLSAYIADSGLQKGKDSETQDGILVHNIYI